MKTLFFALLMIPVGAFAEKELPCQPQLLALNDLGIRPEALKRATKAFQSGEHSRYVLMAQVASNPPNEGILNVVDLKTGTLVKSFPMRSGYPQDGENLQDYLPTQRTFYGSMELDKNMQTKPVSGSLQSKLNGYHIKQQGLVVCESEKAQKASGKKPQTGDLCLSSGDYQKLKRLIDDEESAHKTALGDSAPKIHRNLFIYPKDDDALKSYLKQGESQTDSDNVCQYLKGSVTSPNAPTQSHSGGGVH